MVDKEQVSRSRRRLIEWAAALPLGLALLFALFKVESSLGASFYVLSHRNMDDTLFSSSLISPALDAYVWGVLCFVVLGCLFFVTIKADSVSKSLRVAVGVVSVGLFAVVCLVLFGLLSALFLVAVSVALLAVCVRFAWVFGFSRFGLFKRALLGFLLAAFVVEAGALLFYSVPRVLNLPLASSAFAASWHLVEVSLANSAYPLLPYVYLVFMLLGIAVYLCELARLDGLSKRFAQSRLGLLRDKVEVLKSPQFEPKSAGFPLWLALVISAVVTLLLVEVTVLPWFNPSNRLVSVDAPAYYIWLDRMRDLDAGAALRFSLQNDRSLFLASSYALSFAFPAVNLFQFMPILLVPLFTVACLYFIRLVCGLRESWVYLALIAPFSIQSLALIYSGYYANMLAAVFVYLYFALLLKFRAGDTLRLLLLVVASLLVLFSHSWTWYVFVIALAGFLLLEWRSTSKKPALTDSFKHKAIVFALTVVVGLLADYVRTLLAGKSAAGVVVFETARSGLSLPNPDFILSGLNLTTNFYLGGVFSIALMIALGVLGFLFMLTYRSASSRLMLSWFAVGCCAVLFASGEYVFNRFMFLMPLLIFGALGLALLMRYAVSHVEGRRRLLLEVFIAGLVFLALANFALAYCSSINII